MKVTLSYGPDGLAFEIPESPRFQGVLKPHEAPVVDNPEAAVLQALLNPVAAKPLGDLAKERKSACVVISDITRPVPNKIILPPLLAEIEKAGIKREAITILIATGIHRPNEGNELIALVGDEIAENYRIINHFSKEAEERE